ncbi:putative membrane protein [Acinetobacter sp. AR_0276]|nr:putative membrane protein [Acinetobacter sp. AR_0276]
MHKVDYIELFLILLNVFVFCGYIWYNYIRTAFLKDSDL